CFLCCRKEQEMTSKFSAKTRIRFDATVDPVSWNGEKLYRTASDSARFLTSSQGKSYPAPAKVSSSLRVRLRSPPSAYTSADSSSAGVAKLPTAAASAPQTIISAFRMDETALTASTAMSRIRWGEKSVVDGDTRARDRPVSSMRERAGPLSRSAMAAQAMTQARSPYSPP